MALGNDAPAWLWIACFLLAALALALAVRAAAGSRVLGALLWSIGALGLAGAGTGLMLHRGFLIWDPAVYYFATIPAQMDWENAAVTCAGAVLFSVLGAAIPAARAADIDPVRALRYE
jgi:ABC-type lipoprotein release transport system permease subunit